MAHLGIFYESHYRGKVKNPFLSFDLWAFIVLVFSGYSWGGLITKEKKDSVISFIIAQLWFVIIAFIAFVFLQTKGLNKNSYMYIFLLELIKACWMLHLVNYIPIPPFDASFFYAQKQGFKKTVIVLKCLATVIIMFPVHNDFLSGNSLLKILRLI